MQAAAFDGRDPAEKLAATLSDEFRYQTMVAPVESNGKTLFRIRMLCAQRRKRRILRMIWPAKLK
jgi:hypothetical protein